MQFDFLDAIWRTENKCDQTIYIVFLLLFLACWMYVVWSRFHSKRFFWPPSCSTFAYVHFISQCVVTFKGGNHSLHSFMLAFYVTSLVSIDWLRFFFVLFSQSELLFGQCWSILLNHSMNFVFYPYNKINCIW